MFVYSLAGLQLDESGASAVPIEENETTARSAVYQVLGRFLSTPDDEHFEKAREGLWAKELIEAGALLPFALEASATSIPGEMSRAAYEQEYARALPESKLCGAEGAPDRDQVLDELHRAYEYFGLKLAEDHPYPADHISVACDYMQFLTYKEAAAASDRLRGSYRRAQADYLGKRLGGWAEAGAASVLAADPHPFFAWATKVLASFVAADVAYVQSLTAPKS